mgnify:CR=1 FL=1
MQSSYAEQFQRDMGCTEAEWLGWLPVAMGHCSWQRTGNTAVATIGQGQLNVHWQVMPPRVIALMRMPVLRVKFEFERVNAEERYAFMRPFDLCMQRGGG